MKATTQSIPDTDASTCESLIRRLLRHAETDPERDAAVSPTVRISYAELAQQVQTEARRLGEAGINSNSIVGIRCSDDLQHFLLCLGSIQAGATSIAVPTHESQQVQQSVIEQCGVTHIVDAADIESIASDSVAETRSSGEARLLFSTSGTSGHPKLVIHHDSDLVLQAHRHIGSANERFACLASMEHNFAKRHRLYCLAEGASNVFLDSDHHSLVRQCQSLDVNVLHVSAFQAQELLAVPDIAFLCNLRLKLGGSHVPQKLRQRLREQITENLQAGYGTTETGAIAFTHPDDCDADESVGQALSGIEIRVVDAGRKSLNTGGRGELAIRCEGMFRGYLDNPQLTAVRLEDGWFYTGDIGYLDDKHRIHLCGRSDDMFMFNSMNIHPQDIETQICQYPGVKESVVLPKTSTVHGKIPVAFVVFEEDSKPDLRALKAFIEKRVGARSPRQFTRVAALPRNASGKVSRLEVLTLPERTQEVRSRMIDALSSSATKRLKPAAVAAFKNGDIDIRLAGTGLDSFARMEMLVALEVEYGVVIMPEEFAQFETFGDISSYVLTAPPPEALAPPDTSPAIDSAPCTAGLTDEQTRTLKFFRRVFRHCKTVAHLNKALMTMEHRFTPLEVTFLYEQNLDQKLLPLNAARPFQTAVTTWLEKVHGLMQGSGKQRAEPYRSQRVMPSVTHFIGPGSPANKRLVICFAPKAGRQLTVPNAVLLQHSDSKQYDLLVIADSDRESYRLGVPLLGSNIDEVIDWIGNLELVSQYKAVRTIGCSAGAFLAVIAGHKLGAELALSVAGRFHAERYPHRILSRLFSAWRTVQEFDCSRVLMSYPADERKTRDHIYARIMARLTGGSLVGLEFTDGVAGHHFLQRLAERNELSQYLRFTIFATAEDDMIAIERANVVFSLPAGTVRTAD